MINVIFDIMTLTSFILWIGIFFTTKASDNFELVKFSALASQLLILIIALVDVLKVMWGWAS